ncbi:alpha/beta fold hydrolase [Nocardia camponoti]|uniref:alpha/beta fold hydrolase n=1 Tax=Nocardia camponoti TaxID=1616106 RepID=UPI00166B35F1|nr:alpha/beta hydrolase [Nocardia camponoti]
MLYDEGGVGAPILLLHGLMGSAATWSDQVPWLREFGHVYTFQAAGHGRPVPADLGTDAFAADLAAHTAHIAEPLTIIGHSMGAIHGWVFAAAHPDRVRALVVEDIAPDFTGQTAEGWAALVDSWPQPFADADALVDYFGPVAGRYFERAFTLTDQGYHLHGETETFRAISEDWGTRDFWPEWKALEIPTLLIEAEHTIAPAGQMRLMADVHPNAEYALVADAAHLVHDEQPTVYRELVAGFLRKVLPQ